MTWSALWNVEWTKPARPFDGPLPADLKDLCGEDVIVTRPILGDVLNADDPVPGAYGGTPIPARRHWLVIDGSNEGYPGSETMMRQFARLPAAAVVFAQNNRAMSRKVAWPCRWHRHGMTFAKIATERNYFRYGKRALNRKPRQKVLCLNHTPRLHRLMALKWLAQNLRPEDYFATFSGFARQKIDATTEMSYNLHYFPGADISTLIEEAEQAQLRGDTGWSYAKLVNDIEPELYERTFASLVTETEMTDGSIVRFTEKVLKPIVMGHPFVVLGNPGTLRILESYKLDMLRDEIDTRYDDEPNPARRFDMAIDALAGLISQDPVVFIARNRTRLERNIVRFKRFFMGRVVTETITDLTAAGVPLARSYAETGSEG